MYDAKGRVTKQTDGVRRSIYISYGGRTTILQDGKGYEYRYLYNENGWRTEKVYPDLTKEKFLAYDLKGNLKWWIDTKGQNHRYTYRN